MPQSELLKIVLETLTRLGIEYMITGSYASSLQGEPRATHDIDLVIPLRPESIPALLEAFPSEKFYLDEESIRQALRSGRMFNLIDFTGGGKVDFWILTSTPFDQSRFRRRKVQNFLGIPASFSAPEDTILAKLRWAKMAGGSEKQFRDAVRVYEIQYAGLDLDYLTHWASELEVQDLWHQLQEEASIL